MEAILLGSAGSNPIEIENQNTIPIPTILPNDPTLLTENENDAPYVPAGPTGEGVPAGGLTGQILAKNSDIAYDTEWINPPTGGTSIPESSVINRDINGLITSIDKVSKTINITRVNGQITSVEDGTYQKDIVRVNDLISEVNVTIL